MKKALTCLLISAVLMGLSATAQASEAEQPLTTILYEGKTYQIKSVSLQETAPDYYNILKKIALEKYGLDSPPIFVYSLYDDDLRETLYGFQKNFSDGSNAIYLNGEKTKERGKMVFIHEMAHFVYDTPQSMIYSKSQFGNFRYDILMEALTDVVASEKYGTGYEKAYSYSNLNKLLDEDDFLLSLYKGEVQLESSSEAWDTMDDLELYIIYPQYESEAREAYEKLKSMVSPA